MPAVVKKKAVAKGQKGKNVVIKLPVAASPKPYGGMAFNKVQSYSGILLRAIRRDLGATTFVTREDLIQLAVFSHVSTIYRYSMVCTLVRHLVDTGDLIEKNRTDLYLNDRVQAYNAMPLQDRYFSTIKAVASGKFKLREKFTVMDIVGEWRTDSDLTTNNKRVAVRKAIPKLLREGILVKADDFQYVRK